MGEIFDLAIIGGGINGCGCAAEAALRGLSVALLEKGDLSSQTSSASTKLIHGGLRYLEQYEFSLVKKALTERQRLLNLAPHLLQPQSFVIVHQKQMRPAWLLRLGLFFYDNLSWKNTLSKSKPICRNKSTNYFNPLNQEYTQGFLFYDTAVDDARLTIANALLAKKFGARIHRDSQVIKIEAKANFWKLTILENGSTFNILAKTLINAAGPWVESINQMMQINSKKIALIQGSHIVIPKLYPGNHGYLLQLQDKRLIFVIPYHGFTMIGTTETLFNGSLNNIRITEEEIAYLIKAIAIYFNAKISKEDIIYTWSGVRSLLAQADKNISLLSRDCYFDLITKPLLAVTIYSGKLTTYRQMSEKIVDKLALFFPHIKKPAKDMERLLPGASLGSMNFINYLEYARKRYAWLGEDLLNRYLFSYGTRVEEFLKDCKNFDAMGEKFGDELYQVEVDFLVSQEFAKNADDILKRRTKLILSMDSLNQEKLTHYLNQ